MAPRDDESELDDVELDDCSPMTSVISAGKWLRKAMMQPKTDGSTPRILSFLDSLNTATQASALRQGNNNKKAPLHYASQFRPELVPEFILRGADVNAATLRGHTPLIFAAGRGNNDAVRTLLNNGANPRVIVVTGDTASGMGKSRLDFDTQRILEEAEKSSGLPWQDYRTYTSAQKAQRDHVQTCPHCRRKGEREKALAEKARMQELISCLASELESAMMADPSGASQLIVDAVAPVAARARDRAAVVPAVRKAMHNAISREQVALPQILSICRESSLKAAFHKLGCYDLRPLRSILWGIIEELEESKTSWTESYTIARIVEASDLAAALELLLMKPEYCIFNEQAAIKQFCNELVSHLDVHLFAHSLFSIPERSLPKKAGGPEVLVLRKCLQLVSLANDGSVEWTDLAKDITVEAVRIQKLHLLREALQNTSVLPGCPLALMDTVIDDIDIDEEDPRPKKSTRSPSTWKHEQNTVSQLRHPPYELQSPYFWVVDEISLLKVRSEIEEKIAALACNEKVWLAIDTEWGDDKSASHLGPSIVQLASLDRVWVVDTAKLSAPLQAFFRWLFGQPRLTFFGFAFGQDRARLSALLGQDTPEVIFEVLDLQRLAMADAEKSVTPGLKAVAAAILGVTLDKREQCSDWDRRPLTSSQLRYAAADAAVLLDIAKAMHLKT